MKKYYSKISGCILLVALEILMFLWTPYYKGFICTTYIIEHINAGDIIFRLVYYVMQFIFYLYIQCFRITVLESFTRFLCVVP